MAQAGKFPSTRNLPKTDESVGDTSPPIGKRHEKPISIQLAQDVSLMAWIQRLLARGGGLVGGAVTDFVARLPRGRRPYPRPPIIAVAEELGADPSRESQDDFIYRVRCTLEDRGIDAPGDTVLTAICAPIYKREHAKIPEK
jgi:hypothetical protein